MKIPGNQSLRYTKGIINLDDAVVIALVPFEDYLAVKDENGEDIKNEKGETMMGWQEIGVQVFFSNGHNFPIKMSYDEAVETFMS